MEQRRTSTGTPTRTEHPQTEGVPIALRYTFHQPNKDPIDVEAFWTERHTFHMILDGDHAYRIEEVERDLVGGEKTQYKPEVVDRHYYATLQEACEGAVKTLRRKNEIT